MQLLPQRLLLACCAFCSAMLLAKATRPHPAAVPFSNEGMSFYECPEWLQEYVTFHNVNREKPAAKYLVFSCKAHKHWCGGLGDRIRGIKFALQVAYATQRVFLIDDHKPVPLESILAPHLLNWTTAGLDLHSRSAGEVFWFANEQREVASGGAGLDYSPFTGPTDVVYLFTNFLDDTPLPNASNIRPIQPKVVGDGDMATGVYFDRVSFTSTSCMMRVLFRATDMLMQDYRAMLQRLFNDTEPAYIAMHFRCGGMGKMGEEERVQRTHNNLLAFVNGLSCARHLARKHRITHPILVLTDNLALRQSIRDGYFGSHVTTTTPQAAHIDFLPDYNPDVLELSWVHEAARAVYADLMLLAGGSCLVAPTRSGFVNIARGWTMPECLATAHDHCLHKPLHDSLRTVFNLPHKW